LQDNTLTPKSSWDAGENAVTLRMWRNCAELASRS
jgi:hypothetical protein